MKPQVRRIALYFFFFSLSISAAKAQFSHTLFYDTLTKASKEGYIHSAFAEGQYLYVSGASFSDETPLPTVTKMDTAGKIVWTTVDHNDFARFLRPDDGFGYRSGKCHGTIKTGNRLYTIALSWNARFETPNEIWCISDSTGMILWKSNINNKEIVKIVDYSDSELLAISTLYPGGDRNYYYHVIDKTSGAVLFTKHFGSHGDHHFTTNRPNLFVDVNKNVLLSWDDTCRKFRDNRLNDLAWTSRIFISGRTYMIDKVIQDSGRYIFMGLNYVRSVDTASGGSVWVRTVKPGAVTGQPGGDSNPQDHILKDSMLYVIWLSPYTGSIGLEKGFTLTAFNKYNGNIRYNVAYDFEGIPADNWGGYSDPLEVGISLAMDENAQLYITGSYDGHGIESPSNWGILKIHNKTGAKIYEATITDDSTKRSESSQGRYVGFYNGKMYCLGNLHKKGTDHSARPLFLSFDTTAFYNERFRTWLDYPIRYSSALTALIPYGSSQMLLLKKLGRSGVVECRNINNQLVWSRTFTQNGKYVLPQHIIALGDTAIAASFMVYKEHEYTPVVMGDADSLLFVKLNPSGNTTFTHSIPFSEDDSLSAMQAHFDKSGRTNFIFRKKYYNNFPWKAYHRYTLGERPTQLGELIIGEKDDYDNSIMRRHPVQHFNGDTIIYYRSTYSMYSQGELFSNNQQASSGFYGFRETRNYDVIYSALKLDSVSFLVMGRDSIGRIKADRYKHRLGNALEWSYTGANGIMYNADTSATSVYAVSKSSVGNKLIITKFNKRTGAFNWNAEKTPAAKSAIIPADFKYDPINHYYIVGGHIVDTLPYEYKTRYFYLRVDTSGNIVKDVVVQGYALHDTRINVVNVLQNGTHAFGGSIGTREYGVTGFYNADCFVNNLVPSVAISTASITVCRNDVVSFKANPIHGGDQPVYQWQVNGVNAGSNSDSFSISTLNSNDKVSVKLVSNAQCIQANTATSNVITMSVSNSLTPAVSISGTTTVMQGHSTLITANPSGTGSGPVYQWQDSTATHSWQPVPGAQGNTLNYTPASSGDKLRCVIKTSASCATIDSAISNRLVFIVNLTTGIPPIAASDFGIKYYPNPVDKWLTIDSLKLPDAWQTLEIIMIDSRQRFPSINISNRTRATINTERLARGVYIAVLRRKQGAAVYLKFVKW
jgi:hypothetical protein